MNFLPLLLILPFILAGIFWLAPKISSHAFRWMALLCSLLPLLVLIMNHDQAVGAELNYPWFSAVPIAFHAKVDALSLLFLYLTALIVFFSICSVDDKVLAAPKFFYFLVFLLEGLLFLFFTMRDLVFFTIFWEAMLLPLYFLINVWGGHKREAASLKFLIYMIAGSALLVFAVLTLYLAGGKTFDIDQLAAVTSSLTFAPIACAIFLLAFAVKTPLFPFHGWLPDAYCQASTPATILLAGILSKAGIYGIFRIGFELFPLLLKEWSPVLLALSIAGVFYGGLSAWMQHDFKRLIAYSSFSHVNFILVGLFVWDATARTGALLQVFNHGITITALFLVAGWLEQRLQTTSLLNVSGLTQFLPHLSWLTLFFVLASVALPGTNNFVGELLILYGLFVTDPWVAGGLALSVILSVIYMLRWMQKMYFEGPTFFQEKWVDIGGREMAIAAPLIALVLWVGIYPNPLINAVKPVIVAFQSDLVQSQGHSLSKELP